VRQSRRVIREMVPKCKGAADDPFVPAKAGTQASW